MRSASSVFADSASRYEGRVTAVRGAAPSPWLSTTTWTLVPLMPKELTAPTRSRPGWAGQGRASLLTWKGLRAQSMYSLS